MCISFQHFPFPFRSVVTPPPNSSERELDIGRREFCILRSNILYCFVLPYSFLSINMTYNIISFANVKEIFWVELEFGYMLSVYLRIDLGC